MSIDLTQFHQAFFEDSFEGLDIVESSLLDLDPEISDPELINTIFRLIHSIKGGAATFGFQFIADFAHGFETLLDQLRSGTRSVDHDMIKLFLESVDAIRDALKQRQSGIIPDASVLKELSACFAAYLSDQVPPPSLVKKTSPQAAPTSSQTVAPSDAEKKPQGLVLWAIAFHPKEELLLTGNEPKRLIKSLQDLGDLKTTVILPKPCVWEDFQPEHLYLAWQFELRSSASEACIREVFDWVLDICQLDMHVLEAAAAEEKPEERQQQATAPLQSGQETAVAAPMIEKSVPSEPLATGQPIQDSVAAKEAAPKKASKSPAHENTSVRVSITKVDQLVNMIGELVITQSMLTEIGDTWTPEKINLLQEGLAQLERNTRDLQEAIMRIRMLPISMVFGKFPRMVHDVADKVGKDVVLELHGESTELDKTVLEKIGDPLVHLIRNALDHGLESPEKRLAQGKPAQGTLILNAYHQSGNVIIEIQDDGQGIDPEKILRKAQEKGLVASDAQLSRQECINLIFRPGFSTAENVSDLSGRGVGMDVVKRNIQELNGVVEVHTDPGKGSLFRIKLPLTLAILDGQLIRVGRHIYIIPMLSIVESLQVEKKYLNDMAGQLRTFHLRDTHIPILPLSEIFNIDDDGRSIEESILVVLEHGHRKVGLVVDDLLHQQQVVIKALDHNYDRVPGILGAATMGNGSVSLIVDVAGLVKMAGDPGVSSKKQCLKRGTHV